MLCHFLNLQRIRYCTHLQKTLPISHYAGRPHGPSPTPAHLTGTQLSQHRSTGAQYPWWQRHRDQLIARAQHSPSTERGSVSHLSPGFNFPFCLLLKKKKKNKQTQMSLSKIKENSPYTSSCKSLIFYINSAGKCRLLTEVAARRHGAMARMSCCRLQQRTDTAKQSTHSEEH